jgi:hypothetical protein
MKSMQEDSPMVTGVRTQLNQPTITNNSEAFWYTSDDSAEVIHRVQPLLEQAESSTNIVLATERDESNQTVNETTQKNGADLLDSTESYEKTEPVQVIKKRQTSVIHGTNDMQWGLILPRLRKSIRRFDPMQMRTIGTIWP